MFGMSFRIIVISHRVAGAPGAVGATATNGPTSTDEWLAAETYTEAIRQRAPKGVKVELIDRLKSVSTTLQLLIDNGVLSAPTVLVFREPGNDGSPRQTVAVWRYLPSTASVINAILAVPR